jgi:short-subunit dehydrogenase
MEIRSKVILITGASSGIGRAVALKLAAHGNRLVLTARRKQLLQQVAAEVAQAGSEAICFPGDATEARHAEKVVRDTARKYGRIDLAILNVGAGPVSNTLTAPTEKILGCMRANYDTMVNFFVPVLSQMRRQKTPAMITHVNSLATYFGLPMQGDYTAAKAAARIFLETARMELKHFAVKHIRIQTIHPGFVDAGHSGKDAIPAPNQISSEQAADYILRGIQSEKPENRFPLGTALAVRIGRIAPLWLRTKILLKATPKQY